MTNTLKIFIILIISYLSACTTTTFHRTDAENTWVSKHVNILGLFHYSDEFYCMANKEAGKATLPVCSKALHLDNWNKPEISKNQK